MTRVSCAERACRARAVLRHVAYPGLLVAVTALGWLLLDARAPEPVVLFVPVVLLALALEGLERVVPWEPAWRAARGDVRTDVAHTIATVSLAPLVQGLVLSALPVREDGVLAAVSWLPLEVALLVVLGDLGPYLFHRASHEWSASLFRVHAVHHSPTRLYWLNAFRVHPINLAANTALRLLPAALLGASPEALALAALLSAFGNAFSHANVDLATGWLDRWLSTPRVHRLHHHVEARASQSNYGGFVLVWDHLFRSARPPDASVRDGHVGVDGAPPEGWLAQLLHPVGVRCCAGA
ncbi:MAG: sterol desaturase family protein [Sandaracinaceae bacterium]|nr:sterol desaturase family protein [Sandaracinaceae bacterium]